MKNNTFSKQSKLIYSTRETTQIYLWLVVMVGILLYACSDNEETLKNNSDIVLQLRTDSECEPAENYTCAYDTVTGWSTVYEGCPFYMSWISRTCNGSAGPVVSIYNMQYYPDTTSAGCDDLQDYWDSLYYANDFVTLNTALNEMNRQLSHQIEAVITSQMKFNNEIPSCESGRVTTFDFYESGCLTRCPEEGENGIFFTEIECGTACCIRSTDVCLNDNGVPVRAEAAYVTIGECGDAVSECERPLAAWVTPCERL